MKYTKSELKKTGVYEIVHVASNRRYVGSASKSFSYRWDIHRRSLRNGKHHSFLLQRDWDKYGEDAFEFRISEFTLPAHAVAVEQTFIDWRKSANPDFGYNISPTASSPLGVKRTPQQIAAMSDRAKKYFASQEIRDAFAAKTRQQFESQEARDASSKRAIEWWSQEGRAEEQSKRAAKQWASQEARDAQAARARKQMSCPKARETNSINGKKRFESQEYRDAISAIMKAALAKKEVRENMSNSSKKLWASQDRRKAQSDKLKKRFESQEERDAQSARLKKRFESQKERDAQSDRIKAFFADPIRKAEYLRKRALTLASKKLAVIQMPTGE